MVGYFGETAKMYGHSQAKRTLLMPAISSALPKTKSPASLLDVGCGDAVFAPLVADHGYTYYGLDISGEMIEKSRLAYPNGQYQISSSLDMASKYTQKFEAILISMLFLVFDTKEQIYKTLSESRQLLKDDGVIIVGNPYPAFDSYMRGNIFHQPDVEEKFSGYFTSGNQYFVNKDLGDHKIRFENYHWTLTDYFDCIKTAGLYVSSIDECRPDQTDNSINQEYNLRRTDYPTYLVMTLKKATT